MSSGDSVVFIMQEMYFVFITQGSSELNFAILFILFKNI